MKKKKGFTLIELIAVVAILAVLAAVAVPRVISYVERSKVVSLKSSCKVIYNAAENAYNDGCFEEQIKKEKPLVDKDGKMTEQQVLNYVSLPEIMNILYEKHYLKGDEVNTKNVIKNLSAFGYIDLIIRAPEDMIKLDSEGGITEESANEIYEKYWR